MPVADVLAMGVRREEDLERHLATEPSGVLVRFDFYRDRTELQDSGLRLYKRGVGSSFTLGDATLGLLGSDLDPQPLLGVTWAWETEPITGLNI